MFENLKMSCTNIKLFIQTDFSSIVTSWTSYSCSSFTLSIQSICKLTSQHSSLSPTHHTSNHARVCSLQALHICFRIKAFVWNSTKILLRQFAKSILDHPFESSFRIMNRNLNLLLNHLLELDPTHQ